MEEPLIIVRMLLWRALNRDGACVAGVPNGSWLWSWPGRGDQLKRGDRNMMVRIQSVTARGPTKIEVRSRCLFWCTQVLIANACLASTRCLVYVRFVQWQMGDSGAHMQEQSWQRTGVGPEA